MNPLTQDLVWDILARGCAESSHAYPCYGEVVAAVQLPAQAIGLCQTHVLEYPYYPCIPLRALLSVAWEEGKWSDEYSNPWN